jgi:hypothetical protein
MVSLWFLNGLFAPFTDTVCESIFTSGKAELPASAVHPVNGTTSGTKAAASHLLVEAGASPSELKKKGAFHR